MLRLAGLLTQLQDLWNEERPGIGFIYGTGRGSARETQVGSADTPEDTSTAQATVAIVTMDASGLDVFADERFLSLIGAQANAAVIGRSMRESFPDTACPGPKVWMAGWREHC